MDLIMRFYQPDSGRIYLDGEDISGLRLSDYRQHIGYVGQDVFLWNQSIKENLLYGNPRATNDQLIEVCRKAQLLSFIESLPDKWDTIIGERGVRISGGEKQRIGIARALLQNPMILLMDEPTSALDVQTEQLLSQCLLEFFHGRTVMVVAHRLSTIQDADYIFVINEGSISEKGTYDEFNKAKGIYYGLVLDQQLKDGL
ncbi:ABC-type multidrug transport system fused ATPase/permease subunit [Croceifilum oryzae]|uniref:ABC-type multidrug transport system fused ATPase/permease subunit n=1 Tax=Croceifilum oryzae TaxID=1553429 RepID=A0AAJ1TL56_9BACL|nr:ATP-binding cassette domain-containing protein [Croceifilum oryzae]MDQ0418144.1 ABC-type multidrug transport system fused ATPase/permease subunit [Croceifilum oryzae]